MTGSELVADRSPGTGVWPLIRTERAALVADLVELSDDEIDRDPALMDSMTRENLEGDEFQDAYTEAIAQIIEAKREHRGTAADAGAGGQARQGRRPDGGPAGVCTEGPGLARRGRRRARAAEEEGREEAAGQEDGGEKDHEEGRGREDVRAQAAQRRVHVPSAV
ncbi:hypothetical protein ACWKT3_16800 [Streptomyces violaceus]